MGATASRSDAVAASAVSEASKTLAGGAAEDPSNHVTDPSNKEPSHLDQPTTTDQQRSTAALVAALAALDTQSRSNAGTSSREPTPPWWRNFPRSELPNPGTFEEMSQEATLILRPNIFEGLQFHMNMPVGSQSFSLGHAVELGAKDHPGSYAFSANYFTNRLVMLSRVTAADGRVNGRIFYNHTPSLSSKIMADVGPDAESAKASWDLDYRGTDFTSQLKVANGGIAAVSYMQSITPTIALGGEGFYQGKSRFSAITAAAKYANGTDVASVSVASFGPVIMSFLHRMNPRSAFATELCIDGRTLDSHVSCGYRYDLTSSTVIGTIDSSGRIAATVEERLNPVLSFLLSGEIDHLREEYRFGFGINIGGS